MTTPSPHVAEAARRFADQQSARHARAAAAGTAVFATVASVTTGPPRVVTVTLRDGGHPVEANWVNDAYTPVVTDRVLCVWVGRNQLAVVGAGS